MSFIAATLYHFFDFPHFAAQREVIKAELRRLEIKGTLLLTPEGINGTLAGTREAIDALLTYLREHVTYEPFEHKESICNHPPFLRTKVKLKKETVSIGAPNDLGHKGEYISPQDWNALISDPDTIVLDTRNAYEVELGTFAGAHDPKIRTFKQFPEYVAKTLSGKKDKKIAMFCTGGIRCEKATAWMKAQGFTRLYHLKGGILKYLEEIPVSESKWQGECFVFDDRVAVGHGLIPLKTAK